MQGLTRPEAEVFAASFALATASGARTPAECVALAHDAVTMLRTAPDGDRGNRTPAQRSLLSFRARGVGGALPANTPSGFDMDVAVERAATWLESVHADPRKLDPASEFAIALGKMVADADDVQTGAETLEAALEEAWVALDVPEDQRELGKLTSHVHEARVGRARPYEADRRRVDAGDYIRASGDAECPACGLDYWQHAPVPGYGGIRRACDGRLLKT